MRTGTRDAGLVEWQGGTMVSVAKDHGVALWRSMKITTFQDKNPRCIYNDFIEDNMSRKPQRIVEVSRMLQTLKEPNHRE